MKKILFLLLLIPFISGCPQQGPCRVVTDIHITSGEKQYHYNSPRKIDKILIYLRSLETWGPAVLDELEGAEYRITLTFSDGSTKVYRQRNYRCLSVNNGNWLRIYPENAEKLPLLLEVVPPDG